MTRYTEPQGQAVLRMKLVGANPEPRIQGLEELPGKSNYLVGSNPEKWRTNVPTYARVLYTEVYPGVDLVYYGIQGKLEYDFIVAPSANPDTIRLTFEGAEKLDVDAQGDLLLHTQVGPVLFKRPFVYQQTGADSQEIYGSYVVAADRQVSFQLGAYDATRPLIIDPVLVYSTYLGGSGVEAAFSDIAVDPAGNAYVTGVTRLGDFPTANPLQQASGGFEDAFVTKLNPTGSALVYSTYLGGSSIDLGVSIAIDPIGNAYVAGYTASPDFPTLNALQATLGGGLDAFVAKLTPDGTALEYSTYLGGSGNDPSFDIAVDSAGSAYLTGLTESADFPAANPLQLNCVALRDAFVTKLNPTGSALVFSTYLCGSGNDIGRGIAIDSAGNTYVTGHTGSANFPTVNPFQPAFAGGIDDGFITKLNPTGSALVYSTYLGGSGFDQLHGLATDPAGNAYVTGYTGSADFPTVDPLQQPALAVTDAVVAELNPAGGLIYSTYLGGSGTDRGSGIAVDAAGNVYVTGHTESADFPTVNPLQLNYAGLRDVFVTKFNSTGSSLVYSTYLGGSDDDNGKNIAVGSDDNVYVTGLTRSTNLPTANPLQPANGGGSDSFVARIFGQPTIGSVFPAIASPGTRLTLTGSGFSAGGVSVSFGGVPGTEIVVLNDTTLLVTVPILLPGPVEITVITVEGKATLPPGPGGFTIVDTIPALSTHGLILLALALLLGGICYLRRKKVVE